MSKRPPEVSVLTANRLKDGIVVYLAADGSWVESVGAAAIARSGEEAQALKEQGVRDAARNLVVEPYLAAVDEAGHRLTPVRMRERVRMAGPSVLAHVPGYVPPSPRAAPTSPRAQEAPQDGSGERQRHAQAPASLAPAVPGPLPAGGERGSSSEAA